MSVSPAGLLNSALPLMAVRSLTSPSHTPETAACLCTQWTVHPVVFCFHYLMLDTHNLFIGKDLFFIFHEFERLF